MKIRDRYRRLTLWSKIAFWGSIASLAGLCLAVALPTFSAFNGRLTSRQSHLELVEAAFLELDEEFPILDIKLRNTGAVAYVKRAEFHVESVWPYQWVNCPSAVPASWTYDVLLPIVGNPREVQVPVSQLVASQSVDRFQFRLGNNAPLLDDSLSYAFVVNLTLVYNEDDRRLTLPTLGFISGPAQALLGWTQCRDHIDVYPRNKRLYLAFRDFKGIMSNNLRIAISKYEKDIAPRLAGHLQEAGDDQAKIEYYIWSLYYIASVEEDATGILRDVAEKDVRPRARSLAREALLALERGEARPKPWSTLDSRILKPSK